VLANPRTQFARIVPEPPEDPLFSVEGKGGAPLTQEGQASGAPQV
jgi:hypothetical protein